MRKIDEPLFNLKTILNTFVSDTNRKSVKNSIGFSSSILENCETSYRTKIINSTIHEISRMKVTRYLGKPELLDFYDYRLVKKKSGRFYYDAILISAPKGKCPYCSVRDADTVDHYLPKALYPIYSVTPINLLPSCMQCNKGKGIEYPTKPEEQTLHPYFDYIENNGWLSANIIQLEPISINYSIQKPIACSNLMFERVKNHFKSYSLNIIFASRGNEELIGLQYQLKKQFSQGGTSLKDFLVDAYESKKALGINSWQAVLYLTLSTDEWFLNGCEGTSFFEKK